MPSAAIGKITFHIAPVTVMIYDMREEELPNVLCLEKKSVSPAVECRLKGGGLTCIQ